MGKRKRMSFNCLFSSTHDGSCVAGFLTKSETLTVVVLFHKSVNIIFYDKCICINVLLLVCVPLDPIGGQVPETLCLPSSLYYKS